MLASLTALVVVVLGSPLAWRYYYEEGTDRIPNGKIAFDLHGEAAPVSRDPEGMGIAEEDIWMMNPDGSNREQLTENSRVWDVGPVWSPDGERIAFVKKDPGGDQSGLAGRIIIMDPDGSDRIEISQPKGGGT